VDLIYEIVCHEYVRKFKAAEEKLEKME